MKLFEAHPHRDVAASHFTGPPVTAARTPELGTIQHRALADVTDLGQTFAQAIVLSLQGAGIRGGFFHEAHFSWTVNLRQVYILVMHTLFFPPWRSRLAAFGPSVAHVRQPSR